MHKTNKTIKSKHKAFSLVEVLISLLILSVIMVAMAPVITKKTSSKKTEGIVFLYEEGNKTSKSNVCYTTTSALGYASTNDCSEYTFTVPEGVHSIDLTLVAGGGGGGGAAAETITSTTILSSSNSATLKKASSETLKSLKVNYLVASGQDGDDINTNCISGSGGRCGGKGGSSSPALYDFDFPASYMAGGSFDLKAPTSLNDSIVLSKYPSYVSVALESEKRGNLSYRIDKNAASYITSCTTNGNTYSTTDEFDSRCLIPAKNFISSKSGYSGQSVNKDDEVSTDTTLIGGTGASVKNILEYGAGGTGATVKLACTADKGVVPAKCKAENTSSTRYETAASGGEGSASVTYVTATPGGTGGGGAAGTVIKINSFLVTPGEEYTIVVGKGGAGGMSGISISSSVTSKTGANGQGGVSSAIYKANGDTADLIYMVNGGVGGTGGSSSSSSIAASGRNVPVVFSGKNSYFDNIKLDENKVKIATGTSSSSPSSANAYKALSYPIFDAEPYKTFVNGLVSTTNDSKTGGFSNFRTSVTGSQVSINDSNVDSVYDGFYYRSLANGIPSYVGGLGGHTGFGAKAGCGGYFMGNFDGRQVSTTNATVQYAATNKFIVDGKLYDLFTYYGNCNSTNSDGKTADFVLPDPVAQTYGQAGTGGGGGGYNIINGAGKGGDGQNGYVMINWQR